MARTFGDNAGVGNGVGTGSRPDLVGDPEASVNNADVGAERGPLILQPGRIRASNGLTFGNVGRNTLYLPGRLNFDFGTFKRFAISEHAGFEFKWETFNLFNHTQYGGQGEGSVNGAMDTSDPGANLATSGFGHINVDARTAHHAVRAAVLLLVVQRSLRLFAAATASNRAALFSESAARFFCILAAFSLGQRRV